MDIFCLNYQLNHLNFSLLRKVSHKCRISLLQIWYRLQKRNVGSTLQIHSDRMQIHLTSFLHCANIFNASMVNMWALMSCHFFWLCLCSRMVWMTTFTNQTSHLMREIQKSVQKKRKTFSKCQKILHVSISTPTIYSTIKQKKIWATISSNAVSFVARNESSEWFKLKPKTFTYLKILWIFCWLQKCHEYGYMTVHPCLFTPRLFTPRRFTPKTFHPQDFSPPWLFTPKTFQPQMFHLLLYSHKICNFIQFRSCKFTSCDLPWPPATSRDLPWPPVTSRDLAVPRPGEPDGVLAVPGGGVVQVGLAGGAAVVRRGAAAAAAARPPARVLPLPRAVPVSALLRQEGRPQPAPGDQGAAHWPH